MAAIAPVTLGGIWPAGEMIVNIPGGTYDLRIGGGVLAIWARICASCGVRRSDRAVVTDENVAPLYRADAKRSRKPGSA
ncbi:MAG: hypothetical protein ACLSVD_12605 [Eggerthellaceae bacterium]